MSSRWRNNWINKIKGNKYKIEFIYTIIDINDSRLRDKDIIWVINGNKTIYMKHLEHIDRYYLILDNRYIIFKKYKYVFIEIDNKICKIYPKYVKNFMIDIEKPISKDLFISYLKNNDEKYFGINVPNQSFIYIKQQGAGNGKTFGLIQNISNRDFQHYTTFIIITKQHSAKTIIYNEFMQQINDGIISNISKLRHEYINKKYHISYLNTYNNKECNILITTIDAFMWKLGDNKNDEINKFQGIINSIIKGYMKDNNINSIFCNGFDYKLNKETCIFIDESQDLSINYGKALIEISRNNYVDLYVVGDKLQSIQNMENIFNYFIKSYFLL
jgi:hypothetical protein